jgi:hypothetical protein
MNEEKQVLTATLTAKPDSDIADRLRRIEQFLGFCSQKPPDEWR